MSASLSRTEYAAMAGGALLAISIFLKWYEAVSDLADFKGVRGRGTYSGWEAHDVQRWLLLLAAAAPFILAYIIATNRELSWARGELTAVAMTALALVAYDGLIDRPGEPSGQIELEFGWYFAIAGVLAMLAGSALRSSEVERRRKPPGTI